MLEFRLLGQFDVRANGHPLSIPTRLAQSLLAYLLLDRSTAHRREKVAGLFWPDMSERNARHNLRHELWRLRKAINAVSAPHSDLFIGDDLSFVINPRATYWLDVAVLEDTFSGNPSTDDLMRALDVYQGDLLPDFYDEWVSLERERLRSLFEQQVVHLLECLRTEQRWLEMLTWADRWIALGGSPEPAFRALMVAHSALGNRSKVAAVFERCVTALRQDLGVEPSEQTRALYERLSRGQDAQRGSILTAPPPPLPTFVVVAEGRPESAEPPYKGLRYFDEADASLFFGRERLVALLFNHLCEHHWLTVVGASGCGKSSLMRAGLIPALKAGPSLARSMHPPEGSYRWDVRVLTPTFHPLEALAVSLTRGAPSLLATTTLMDDLARDTRTLRVYAHRMVPDSQRLLLVIDQFEELFTLCREELERQAFIDNLLLATAPELDQPVSVVVALRADFYAHCAQYPNLREALARRQEYIGPMTVEEMRRAIEGPAQGQGWELEPGLADWILRDVGSEPGALPLLSHALLETWQRRRERRLTLEGYAGSGGVRGAIAQTAETVFRQLSPTGQGIARHIFLQLTQLGEGTQDTRRRVTLEELVPPAGEALAVREVLNLLAQARLVTLGEDIAEVAHEALIREWPTLREWLNQNREGLRLHRRLAEAAQAWQKANRDEGELYRGARLTQALEWKKTRGQELNPLEREFLGASKESQDREEADREAQRQRELEAARRLAEAEQRRAETERRHAERAENERRVAFVRELAVNAINNLDTDPERSILLALRAVSVSSEGGRPVLREAEEALHRAVQASRVQLTLRGHTDNIRSIAFSPDGKRLATGSIDKTVRMWDATTGQELLTLSDQPGQVYTVAYSCDGTRLAVSFADGTVQVLDALTGRELLTLSSQYDDPQHAIRYDLDHCVALSPDGKRLLTLGSDNTARVWDAATGQTLLTLAGHTADVTAVNFSRDGRLIGTGSDDRTAKVWDAATG